jgi:hypothetical protein
MRQIRSFFRVHRTAHVFQVRPRPVRIPYTNARRGQLRRLDVSFHRRPRFRRTPRRPVRGGPACSTRVGPSPSWWCTAAPAVGAASRFSFRASPSTASSFSGAPRLLIRAATQAPRSRIASGASRTGRPFTVSTAGRGTRSVHAIGREPQLAVGLFHPQRVAAVASDDLDSLAIERMNWQPDRRHRPVPERVRPGVLRLALLGLGRALCLSLSGASGAP